MARIEWVKQRLDNWALYREREAAGGLGFAKQSSFLNAAATTDRYRESKIPVDDIDAAETNQAVQSLRPARSHLYATLDAYYLRGLGEKGSARHLGVVESTVRARLEEADRALALWFGERQAQRKKTYVGC